MQPQWTKCRVAQGPEQDRQNVPCAPIWKWGSSRLKYGEETETVHARTPVCSGFTGETAAGLLIRPRRARCEEVDKRTWFFVGLCRISYIALPGNPALCSLRVSWAFH